MTRIRKLLVNAIPLTYVATGVGRYLRCLYQALERLYADRLEIWYFDGSDLSCQMPQGPSEPARWSACSRMFWKLPAHAALGIRRFVLARHERRFLRLARGFDLYHEAGFFPFRTPPGTATVFTLHDMSVLRMPEHHPRERVFYVNRFLPHRVGLASRFLAVSAFTKAEAVDCLGLAPEKVTVTHLAPEPGFSPQTDPGLRSRLERRGLPERYFLFVGSNDPRKNAERIPRALVLAGLAEPLACAGWSGWGENERRAGNVLDLGYLPDRDLPDVYSGALALVYPSSYEGFGLPVVEAMACGCPVITAARSSLPEVAGDAALYVDDPTDEAQLARQLARVAADPGLRQELSDKGRAQAARFSWDATARDTLDAFLLALAEDRPAGTATGSRCG